MRYKLIFAIPFITRGAGLAYKHVKPHVLNVNAPIQAKAHTTGQNDMLWGAKLNLINAAVTI